MLILRSKASSFSKDGVWLLTNQSSIQFVDVASETGKERPDERAVEQPVDRWRWPGGGEDIGTVSAATTKKILVRFMRKIQLNQEIPQQH